MQNNSPELLDFFFEDNPYDEKLYSVAGRALYLCQHFERTCVLCSTLIKLKQGGLPRKDGTKSLPADDDFYILFEEELDKILSKHLNETSIFKISGIKEVLKDARISRNYIAHNFLVGLKGCPDPKNYFNQSILDLKDKLEKIAVADVFLVSLLNQITKDEIPTQEAQNKWIENAVNWVIKV